MIVLFIHFFCLFLLLQLVHLMKTFQEPTELMNLTVLTVKIISLVKSLVEMALYLHLKIYPQKNMNVDITHHLNGTVLNYHNVQVRKKRIFI